MSWSWEDHPTIDRTDNEAVNAQRKIQMDYRVRILWSKYAVCCETWEKRKKYKPLVREFLAFRKSSNIPSFWITVPIHGNLQGIS